MLFRSAQLRNWRFQQLLYRAYYDATIRARLRDETAREEAARSELQRASSVGSLAAIAAAEQRLAGAGAGAALRARVFELAEALFQSIHMQLSVPRYRAIAVGRGANLDLIDAPLTNAPWLQEQFSALKKLTSEDARRQEIGRAHV